MHKKKLHCFLNLNEEFNYLKDKCKFVCMIDVDEFIYIPKTPFMNIKDFLNNYTSRFKFLQFPSIPMSRLTKVTSSKIDMVSKFIQSLKLTKISEILWFTLETAGSKNFSCKHVHKSNFGHIAADHSF